MNSIRNKLLAFAILATLLPATVLGALSFWRYQRLTADLVAHELHTLVDYAARELTLWQRERVAEVRALSTSHYVIDGVAAAGTRAGTARRSLPELELYLRSVQKKLEPLLELTVSDAEGRLLGSSSSRPAPVVLPAEWPNTAVVEGVVT